MLALTLVFELLTFSRLALFSVFELLTFYRMALISILERRGLDMNSINVFVEASKTPLPLDCESFLLGGNTLNIRGKSKGDNNHRNIHEH